MQGVFEYPASSKLFFLQLFPQLVLEKALQLNPKLKSQASKDDDLAGLRGMPEFEKLIEIDWNYLAENPLICYKGTIIYT